MNFVDFLKRYQKYQRPVGCLLKIENTAIMCPIFIFLIINTLMMAQAMPTVIIDTTTTTTITSMPELSTKSSIMIGVIMATTIIGCFIVIFVICRWKIPSRFDDYVELEEDDE